RFSLTEARVLYELAHRAGASAGELARQLGLDEGYLSRILRGFAEDGLLARRPSPTDGRRRQLGLTEKGKAAFAPLGARSRREVAALLRPLAGHDQRRLVAAIETIEKLLGGAPTAEDGYLLRPLEPGDAGYVVHRHGLLYAREYGF